MNILKRSYFIWTLMFLLTNRGVAEDTLVFSAVENTLTAKIAKRILQTAYQKIDRAVEIRELPGTRGLFYANTAQTDGEAFRIEGIDKDYPNLRRIEIPICTHSIYLFVKKGREFTVEGWESIPADHRIGYLRGIQAIEKNIGKHRISAEQAHNSVQLFTMLKFDRVDAVLEGRYKMVMAIEELELENIVQLTPAILSHPLYHYVHVKHADLIPRITAVLREMQTSGELLKIQQEVEAAHIENRFGSEPDIRSGM